MPHQRRQRIVAALAGIDEEAALDEPMRPERRAPAALNPPRECSHIGWQAQGGAQGARHGQAKLGSGPQADVFGRRSLHN